MPADFKLTEREHSILTAVIEKYLATAEPVSSQQLCVRFKFQWSSATLRNVLARLEAEGFLNHPYTSAGKVPTVKAYRYFVEQLLKGKTGQDYIQKQIRFDILQQIRETDKIVKLTAKVLAVASQLLAVTWLPSGWTERLRRVQLIRLAARRILLIVHTVSNGEFHQVFTSEEPMETRLMQEVMKLINQHGRGKTGAELSSLAQADWPGMDRWLRLLLQQALHWVSINLNLTGGEGLVVEGASNLIRQPEFDNISATRQLFSLLDQRDTLLSSFAAPGIEGQGLRVVIGESPWKNQLPVLSVVSEEICLDAREKMRIGVVGPQRMAYAKIISLVKDAAEALSRAIVKP